MKHTLVLILAFLVVVVLSAQTPTEETREEALLKQLSQAQARAAQCEKEGPQWLQLQQAAQTSAQQYIKSLNDRHMTLDKDGKVVPLPEAK
jgi:F0F1-type ATP synthase membrane subunit b/b'